MPTISRTLDQLIYEIALANDDVLPRTGGSATAATGSTTQCTIAGEIGAEPAGTLIGAEIWDVTNAQALRITAHTVSAGTATLTFPTATSMSGSTFYIFNQGGKGYNRAQYANAVYAAIDACVNRTWTDLSNISLAVERGTGAVTQRGMRRYEYPIPSTFLFLHAVDLLRNIPVEYHPTGYLNTTRALGDATARTRVSQGFQIDQQALVAYIAVYMGKVGSPTDNLTCVVEGNSSGEPDGTAVTNGTSATVAGTTVQTRMRFVVFTFSPPMLLLENTTYHLTLRRSTANSLTDYYLLGEDDGNNYNGGYMNLYTTDWVTAVTGSDLLFAISEQADWKELRKSYWEVRLASTDSLLIRGEWHEGQVVQLRGGQAIARPASGTTEVPLEPDYVMAFAQEHLKGWRAGTVTAEPAGQGAAMAAQRGRLIHAPYRPLPPNATRTS